MAQMTLDERTESWFHRTRSRAAAVGRATVRVVADRLTVDGMLRALAVLFVPIGIVVIVLGWNGAARTPFVFEQIPYLISGGLLGVGLLTCGGLLYLASWVARSSQLARERDDQLRELLTAIHHDLQRDARQPRTTSTAAATRAAEDTGEIPVVGAFVATPSGTMYHLPTCGVVSGRDDLRQVIDVEGLRPCGMCDPASENRADHRPR